MDILNLFALFAILLQCTAVSADDVGVKFKKAIDRGDFEGLERNRKLWYARKDLLDYVIAKGVAVTIGIINNVDSGKRVVLAALFDKGEEMVDEVLGKVECDDGDLCCLTNYRPELAASPAKFLTG